MEKVCNFFIPKGYEPGVCVVLLCFLPPNYEGMGNTSVTMQQIDIEKQFFNTLHIYIYKKGTTSNSLLGISVTIN